jgi:multidrug efflux pump subunit AcrA (membrane-fusion protein)
MKILRKINILVVFGIVTSVILSGCGNKSHQKNVNIQVSTINARVLMIEEKEQPVTETVPGVVVAKTQAQVASKVMGTLTKVYVKEGQFVKVGQILAKIDASDLQPNVEKAGAGIQEINNSLLELDKVQNEIDAGIQSARANYDFASTSLHRYENLYKREAISKEMYEETVRQYKMAESSLQSALAKKEGLKYKQLQLKAKESQVKADMKLAKTYVGYSSIVSPLSGWVVKKNLDQGSMAVPGQPLLVIESGNYEFESSVKESLLPRLKIGNIVTVSLDALSQPVESRLVEIVPSADSYSRSFTVRSSLPGTDGIRSGMYGKMEISAGMRKMVLVPADSVVQRNSLEGVYCLDSSNQAVYRVVKTGRQYGNMVEISSGLSSGERVVITNIKAVKEGNRVEVVQ